MILCSKKLKAKGSRGVYKRNSDALIQDTLRNHKIFTSAKKSSLFSKPFTGKEHHYLSSYEAEEENNERAPVFIFFFLSGKRGKNDDLKWPLISQ